MPDWLPDAALPFTEERLVVLPERLTVPEERCGVVERLTVPEERWVVVERLTVPEERWVVVERLMPAEERLASFEERDALLDERLVLPLLVRLF